MIGVATQTSRHLLQVREQDRSYHEIVRFLDHLPAWDYSSQAVDRARFLYQACGSRADTIDVIFVAGMNGKSTTMHLTAKLLKKEQLRVVTVYSDKVLQYTECFVVDGEQVSQAMFTAVFNEILPIIVQEHLQVSRAEVMSVAGLMLAAREGAQLVLMEIGYGGAKYPAAFCTPKMVVVTNVARDIHGLMGNDLEDIAREYASLAKPGVAFLTTEASRLQLVQMKPLVDACGGRWLASSRRNIVLPYMVEQLFGRAIVLGLRIAQLYVEDILKRYSPFLRENSLPIPQGRRGRPTTETLHYMTTHPIKKMKDFWAESFDLLHGRFEYLDREKPPVLLDNASNLSALEHTFMGIRLLHYRTPLQGFVLILSVSAMVDAPALMRAVRYLFKRVPGELFIVPSPDGVPACDTVGIVTMARNMGLKVRSFGALTLALKIARESVNERSGLVALTGSIALISAYWQARGTKRLT